MYFLIKILLVLFFFLMLDSWLLREAGRELRKERLYVVEKFPDCSPGYSVCVQGIEILSSYPPTGRSRALLSFSRLPGSIKRLYRIGWFIELLTGHQWFLKRVDGILRKSSQDWIQEEARGTLPLPILPFSSNLTTLSDIIRVELPSLEAPRKLSEKLEESKRNLEIRISLRLDRKKFELIALLIRGIVKEENPSMLDEPVFTRLWNPPVPSRIPWEGMLVLYREDCQLELTDFDPSSLSRRLPILCPEVKPLGSLEYQPVLHFHSSPRKEENWMALLFSSRLLLKLPQSWLFSNYTLEHWEEVRGELFQGL